MSAYFSGKKKKNVISLLSAEFAQRMVNVDIVTVLMLSTGTDGPFQTL